MALCRHIDCNREIEFELTGRWECNYHLGLDFEGEDMHPIRPLSKDIKEPKLTRREQMLMNRIRELEDKLYQNK